MFKVPRHRKFEYKFLYHDPEKEERDLREFRVDEAKKREDKTREGSEFRFDPLIEKRSYARKANMRVLIIVLVLCILIFAGIILGAI